MPARKQLKKIKKQFNSNDDIDITRDDYKENNNELNQLDHANDIDMINKENDKTSMIDHTEQKSTNNEQTLSKIHFIKNHRLKKEKEQQQIQKELASVPKEMLNNNIDDSVNPANHEKTILDKIKENIAQNRKDNKEIEKNGITNRKAKLSRYAKHSKYKRSIIDLMGYKTFSHDKFNYLVLADENNNTTGLMEIVKVGGAGIGGLSPAMKEQKAIGLIKFFRMYPNDVTFVALPIPNDTKKQQRIWNKQLTVLINDLNSGNYANDNQKDQKISQIRYIKDSIYQFKNIEINLINQGFFMFIFQDLSKDNANKETGELKSVFKQTELDLYKKVNTAFILDDQLHSMKLEKVSLSDKENLLRRINNPDSII